MLNPIACPLGGRTQLPEANGAEDHAEHGHQRVEILVPGFQQIIGEQDAHGEQDEHHLRQEQPAAALLHERPECVEDMAHRLVYFFSVPEAAGFARPGSAGIFIPGMFVPASQLVPPGAGAAFRLGAAARSAP